MTLAVIVLALLTLERGAELLWARRNTRRLLARGGREEGAAHYPLIVALHAAWLAGLWLMAWNRAASVPWLAVFVLLQLCRLWVLATLGDRWTTRIIVLPREALVKRGPYRILRHPNYVVVAGEILVLPMAFGLVGYALAFSVLNGAVLYLRIRAEERALAQALP